MLYLHTGKYLQSESTQKHKNKQINNHTGTTTQLKETAATTRSTQSVFQLVPTELFA